MNYLAHLHLAGDDPARLVGGLLGDFMRGVDPEALPDDLRAGLALHRRIDRFTDGHEVFRRSRRSLFGELGHWSGVVVDVVYDHVLARDWACWHDEPLDAFTARAFIAFEARDAELPERLRRAWRRMREIDLLGSYRRLDGALDALRRTAARSRHAERLRCLAPAVEPRLEALSDDFLVFYPQLQRHVADAAGAAAGPPDRG